MARIDVDYCRKSFEQELLNIEGFLQETKALKIKVGRSAYHPIGIRTVEMLAGLQLLRMYLAWEEFIEAVFLRYMCGCVSHSGFSPPLLANRERNIKGAMKTLFGKHRYLVWSPSEILSRAQTYFQNAEPFSTAVRSASHQIEAICTIRNRFAHRSEYAQAQFRRLVRNELGYNPPGMTPGRFLLTQRIGSIVRGQTFFQYYTTILLSVAYTLVP